MLKTQIILKDDGYDDGEKLNEWWWLNGRDDGNYETTIIVTGELVKSLFYTSNLKISL